MQRRVLPRVAEAYALHCVGLEMLQLHGEYLATGDAALLAEVHATSAGLKSVCTAMAAAGIETCRLACGGHGYSAFSGLTVAYCSCVVVKRPVAA